MWVRGWRANRGQSEVLGFVLLFAIVLGVSLSVVLVGGEALNDAKSATSTESAEQTLVQLQSQVAQSSSEGESRQISFAQSGGANSQSSGGTVEAADGSVQIDESDSVSIDETAGHVTIEVTDSSTGTTETESNDLGTIVFEQDGETLAYQGGGVFRKSTGSDQGTIVSPPIFEYQFKSGTPTLSMGITTLSSVSDGGIQGDSFTVEKTDSERHFPSAGIPNPLGPGDSIEITVQSEYYRAWGSLFEARTDVSPTYDHPNNEVTLSLAGPSEDNPDVSGALAANPGGTLTVNSKVYMQNYHSTGTPSYDSTVYIQGTYDGTNGASDGKAQTDGNLEVKDDLEVEATGGSENFEVNDGDTIVGNDVDIHCRCEFDGDVNVGGTLVNAEGHGGDDVQVAGDLYVDGDVQDWEKVEVHGDVHVGGDLNAEDDSITIHGDLFVDGTYHSDWNSEVDGTDPDEPQAVDFPPNDPVSDEINGRSSWASDNENPGDGTINDIENSGGCTPCSLDDGEYYADSIILDSSSETLNLDTSDGPVEIYVENDVKVDGGTIDITGDEPVRVYTDGELQWQGGSINTPHVDPHAPAFWVYMHPDENAQIHAEGFVGVVYAPGSGSGTIELDYNANSGDPVYGSLIGEIQHLNRHSEIRFDEALLDASADPEAGNPSGDRVAWLQISTTSIEVSDD